MGEIICFAMQKGGVAKSTSAVNFAAVLANNYNKKVLVIDLDPQANLSFNFGIVSFKKDYKDSVVGLMLLDRDIKELIQPTNSNVDIVFSHDKLYTADINFFKLVASGTKSQGDIASILKEKLQPIKDEYDYILIDCPPALGMLTINAFNASDSVLVPIGCDIFSLSGLNLLLTYVEMAKEGNPSLKVKGIFGTMFDPRTNLSSQVMQKIRQIGAMKDIPVYDTTISKCVKHAEAPSQGMPSVLLFPKNELVQQYVTLVKEVFGFEK